MLSYAVLSNAQVAVILQMSKGNAVNRDEELNEVYRKTLKYVMRFNTMSNPEKQNQEVVDELDNLQEYVIVCCCVVTVCCRCGAIVNRQAQRGDFVDAILNRSPSHTSSLWL
jgi:DNA-directed RNA polymerase subunit F